MAVAVARGVVVVAIPLIGRAIVTGAMGVLGGGVVRAAAAGCLIVPPTTTAATATATATASATASASAAAATAKTLHLLLSSFGVRVAHNHAV